MGKRKFYVIWKGKKTGIFTSWDECKDFVLGFTGAKYKSFETMELAREAFNSNSKDFIGKHVCELSKEEIRRIGNPIEESISVDAAENGQFMEYRGVDTKTGKIIFKQGPFEGGTNNIGEFLAIVHGLAYLEKINSTIPLYSDSITAIGWVKNKKANTRMERSQKNDKLFDLLDRAEKWLIENNYTNKILKWETKAWGEIRADYGRK
jgi:ribonuclease HI